MGSYSLRCFYDFKDFKLWELLHIRWSYRIRAEEFVLGIMVQLFASSTRGRSIFMCCEDSSGFVLRVISGCGFSSDGLPQVPPHRLHGFNIGALSLRIGTWGIVYYDYGASRKGHDD